MELDLILLVGSLVLAALFSALEISYVTANPFKVELDRKNHFTFNLFLKSPAAKSNNYFSTIQVGSNLSVVILSIAFSSIFQTLFKNYLDPSFSFIIETVIVSMLVILFAEFIPKNTAQLSPNLYYKRLSFVVGLFYLLLFPIILVISLFTKLILKMLNVQSENNIYQNLFSRRDMIHFLGETNGVKKTDNDKNIQFIKNALDFSDLRVRECMVQRIDIEGIDIAEPVEILKEKFLETKYKRIIIFDVTIDKVLGYAYANDLLKELKSIEEMLHSVIFVPTTEHVSKLMKNMIKDKKSVAIVFDEFGATAGMITLEDILEEIFGDIDDEHDEDEFVEKQISENEFIISARCEVDAVNEKFALKIPSCEEYDTLAGLVLFHTEEFPKKGDVIKVQDLSIKILKATTNKIELVHILRKKV